VSTYSEKLKDPRWQRKRLEVLSRDKFTCQSCGSTTDTLHVHHCHYFKGDPWNTPDDLLLTLCEECHDHRQECENDARHALGLIMARCPDISGLTESLVRVSQEPAPVLFLFSDNTTFAKALQ
jgi:hypothetical protein